MNLDNLEDPIVETKNNVVLEEKVEFSSKKYLILFWGWFIFYAIIEVIIVFQAIKHGNIDDNFIPERLSIFIGSIIIISLFLLWLKAYGISKVKNTIKYVRDNKKNDLEQDSNNKTQKLWNRKRLSIFLVIFLLYTVIAPLVPPDFKFREYNSLAHLKEYLQTITLTLNSPSWIWILLSIVFLILVATLLILFINVTYEIAIFFNWLDNIIIETNPDIDVMHVDNFMGFKEISDIYNYIIITASAEFFLALYGFYIGSKNGERNYFAIENLYSILILLFVFMLLIVVLTTQKTIHDRMKRAKNQLSDKFAHQIRQNVQNIIPIESINKKYRKKVSIDKFLGYMTIRDHLTRVNERPMQRGLFVFIRAQAVTLVIGFLLLLFDKFVNIT